jgi:Tfp pilus assembly protein PilF
MIRYFILLTLISSCASSSSQEDNVTFSQPEPLAFEEKTPEPAQKEEPVVTQTAPAPEPAKTASALDEAIKSQNDDKIYKQASLALMTNQQDTQALNALALYHYKKGRFNTAKFFLSKAIQIKESTELYNNLGVVHLASGEKKEGLQAFRQALKLQSDNGAAAANFGALLVANRAYPQAAIALEIAYDKGFRDVRVLNNFAVALTGDGKGAQAQQHYEKALRDQPNNKDVLLNYATLLIESLKKPKEGLDVLNRLKLVGPSQDQKTRIKNLENRAHLGLQ